MPNAFCEVTRAGEQGSSAAAEPTRSGRLQHYEAIAQASYAMLMAAHANDWNEVARLEERCCALIANLKAVTSGALSTEDDARRLQLLRQILADDAQIRDQAEPWLQQIAPYISTSYAGQHEAR